VAHQVAGCIAGSPNVFDVERDRCLAAGMNGQIGKPVEPGLLYATALQWLLKSGNPPRS
jgi:CheY-like chemotaxis protein